jgi:hypothetical protein
MNAKTVGSTGPGEALFPEDASKWTDEQLKQLLVDHERSIAASKGGAALAPRSRDEYYEKLSKYDPNDPGQDYDQGLKSNPRVPGVLLRLAPLGAGAADGCHAVAL